MKFNNFPYAILYLLLLFNSFETLIYAQTEWSVISSQFEHSMTITSVVIDESSNYYQEEITIGVFDGDQCMGTVTTDIYFPPIDGNLGFLVAYGNQISANYSIKVIIDDIITDAGNLSFEANGVLGTLELPYEILPAYTILGCTDPEALNYNSTASQDDGSCIEVILGCTDEFAFNYNPFANLDDETCIPIILGCVNENYLEYDVNANSGDESYCINEIVLGCQDDHYVEYNPNANINDGNCATTWQQAFFNLTQECESINESNISINLPNGWSMFGFTQYEATNLIDATYCITEEIIIIKDYLGSAYLPEWDFNGIGTLNPGIGYQIKLTEQINQFNFCN